MGSTPTAPTTVYLMLMHRLTKAIRKAIRADKEGSLLLPEYRPKVRGNTYRGYCYVATEAFLHMIGFGEYKPMFMYVDDTPSGGDLCTHWFVMGPEGVIDPTVDQFDSLPDYPAAKGKGLLTKNPSKRGTALIEASLVYL